MYAAALCLSVLSFLLVGAFFLRHRAFSLFHPLTIYMAFHGVIFVARPIIASFLDYRYIYRAYQFTPSDSDKLTVILASNLGFLVFAFVCLRAGPAEMRFRQDPFTDAERARLVRVLPWVLLLIVPLGVYSLSQLWIGAEAGTGVAGMVLDARTGVFVNTSGFGYLQEIQLSLATCGAMIAWVFRFRLLALLPLLAFLFFRAGTGGRAPFVTAMLTVGLLYLYEKRQKLVSLRVAAIVVAAALAFSLVGGDRGQAIRDTVTGNQQAARSDVGYEQLQFLEGMDLGNLEYFEYLVYAVPQRSGTYDYFLENLQLFTEPIPRSLWAGKPVGAPFPRVNLFEYGYPIGMTRSLPGQGWFFMGWFGVVIWCGLWGYGLGWLYRKFAEGPQNTLQTAAFMVFLPMLVVAYRDGSILTVFRQGLFFLGPIAIWLGLARLYSIPTAQALRSGGAAALAAVAAGRRRSAGQSRCGGRKRLAEGRTPGAQAPPADGGARSAEAAAMTPPLAGLRIGLLTSSASRLGAGVAEAVISQAALIRSLGGEAAVFALEDRHSEEDRARYAPSHLATRKVLGPAQIGYAPGLVEALLETELDCLHQHGIWMYPTRAAAVWARRAGRPCVISPHGMLDPWITARGKWKKALARAGYERDAWRRAYAFHALTRREAEDIRRESGRSDCLVIPNPAPAGLAPPPASRPQNFVYLGRIHPKKNLLALVEAWRLAAPAAGARLIIAGWGENGDVGDLRRALASAPASVEFAGPVYGAEKRKLLESARFMVLASHSEGLPLAILEAWAAAVPAIMTGECNLPEGFAGGAALECGYDAATIAPVLAQALAMDDAKWRAMAGAALQLAVTTFSPAAVAAQWAEAYRSAIAAGSPA